MNIKLDVPIGKYREFTREELSRLNGLLENSLKTCAVKIESCALFL